MPSSSDTFDAVLGLIESEFGTSAITDDFHRRLRETIESTLPQAEFNLVPRTPETDIKAYIDQRIAEAFAERDRQYIAAIGLLNDQLSRSVCDWFKNSSKRSSPVR